MPIYEYKVVPAPQKGVKARGVRGAEDRFAHAVEGLMNRMAGDGWEFLRSETLPSEERTGLTGHATVWRTVMVFRRARTDVEEAYAPRLLATPETAPAREAPPAEAAAVAPATPAAPAPSNANRPAEPPLSAPAQAAPATDAWASPLAGDAGGTEAQEDAPDGTAAWRTPLAAEEEDNGVEETRDVTERTTLLFSRARKQTDRS